MNSQDLYKIESYFFVAIVAILLSIGTIMMYSASSFTGVSNYENHWHYLSRHLKWLLVGLCAFLFAKNINYKIIEKLSIYLLVFSWIIVIIPIILKYIDGTTKPARWLIIGGVNWLTTSDLAKLSIIIFTANFLSTNYKKLNDLKFLYFNLSPFIFITLLLIASQPDLSTTFAIFVIIMFMLYCANVSKTYILTSFFSIGVLGLASILINNFQRRRFLGWINQWVEQNNNISQIVMDQANTGKQALYNGGIAGNGLGNSILKNGYIAEVHTDFILPVIGDELGFIGVLFIFSLFLFLFLSLLKIIQKSRTRFRMFVNLGLTINIIIYFLINSAYVSGIMPTTGLPMPFISYGGSHTIFNLISIGLLFNSLEKNKKNNQSYKGYINA